MEEQNSSEAMELVKNGEVLLRIENETMLAAAIQRPRREDQILAAALRELDLAPEEAKAAYYSIPFKETTPDGSQKITRVEGPSIKAAMALARRWGNCCVGARIMAEDDTGFDLEGVFIDLETNFRVARPQRVSKLFRTRSKGVIVLSPDRLVMALQAGASKAIRNASLAGLPAYYVNSYYAKARALVGGKLDAVADPKVVEAIKQAFTRHKASPEDLERYLGKPSNLWTGEDVADLRGLWNSLQDGQISAEEAFGFERSAPSIAQPLTKAQAAANGPSAAEPAQSPAPVEPTPAAPAASPAALAPIKAETDGIMEAAQRAQEAHRKATAEAAATPATTKAENGTTPVTRRDVWGKLTIAAKRSQLSATAKLNMLMDVSSMSELSDQQVFELNAKLEKELNPTGQA